MHCQKHPPKKKKWQIVQQFAENFEYSYISNDSSERGQTILTEQGQCPPLAQPWKNPIASQKKILIACFEGRRSNRCGGTGVFQTGFMLSCSLTVMKYGYRYEKKGMFPSEYAN
ncbi:hypothetical protein CDAR_291681 [Caerostris darwini]|uniref:Uncharacterized protein n=1 Tax=Caerostris darwini TaxID=1538125 RepID=A0AAV4MU03_9ARAC|nr:hypothetical protein CDAR_291681 [Caerostris darwini]